MLDVVKTVATLELVLSASGSVLFHSGATSLLRMTRGQCEACRSGSVDLRDKFVSGIYATLKTGHLATHLQMRTSTVIDILTYSEY